MEKPFYCFPVVSVLNSSLGVRDKGEGRLYCEGVRALVVDDEPMNLVVAKSIFKRYKMVVTTVSSGRESVEICREKQYDIIFMDDESIEDLKNVMRHLYLYSGSADGYTGNYYYDY